MRRSKVPLNGVNNCGRVWRTGFGKRSSECHDHAVVLVSLFVEGGGGGGGGGGVMQYAILWTVCECSLASWSKFHPPCGLPRQYHPPCGGDVNIIHCVTVTSISSTRKHTRMPLAECWLRQTNGCWCFLWPRLFGVVCPNWFGEENDTAKYYIKILTLK